MSHCQHRLPRRHTTSAARALPVPSLIQTVAFWRDPHAYLRFCRARYGSRFTIKPVGLPPLVFMSSPADIAAIVKAPADVLHPGAGGSVIAPLVGHKSFMLADEDTHLEGRRAILPAFKDRSIQAHAGYIEDLARRELETWPRDVPVAIHPFLRALTLRVILHAIFGPETTRLRDLHKKLFTMLSVTSSLTLQEPQLRSFPVWNGIWRRFLTAQTEVTQAIDSLIRDEAYGEKHERGLLATLLDSPGSNAEQAEIRETIMSIILAGHETTASELAWAFQLLAFNPIVTSRLVDELGTGSERYLQATIQEVLRHRPVFLFAIPRAVQSPFLINDTTYHPPTHLVGCIYLMHHDPALFPQPEQFLPDRFLKKAPDPTQWMPWGGGRKRCPGHHLATLELSILLRAVLSRVEILPAAPKLETARWRSVIVTPGRGCRIVLRQRHLPLLDRRARQS